MIHALLAILPLNFTAIDSLPMDTAKIVVARQEFAQHGGFVRKLYPGPLASSTLAGLLSENGIYVKQYGYTGSSTISLRGADPQQTQVLWNGIAVSNPMLGMADLNTYATAGIDDVVVLGSGSGSFYGSGNVGGSLLLSHNKPGAMGVSANAGIAYSTYGNYVVGADAGIQKKQYYFRNTISSFFGNNNFPYRIDEYSADARMTASRSEQFLNRFIAGYSRKRMEFKTVLEYSNNIRNLGTIPGTAKTNGTQWDRSLRGMLEGKWKFGNWNWSNRVAAFSDYLRFADSNTAIDDTSRSLTSNAQTELRFERGNWRVLGGADLQAIWAETESYYQKQRRIYPANFLAVFYKNTHWEFMANGRFEWYEKIPVFGALAKYRIKERLDFYTSAHNSFRRPSLNDVFWDREANEQLVSERGLGVELGCNWRFERRRYLLHLQSAIYYRILQNPIVWMPSGSGWEATNLHQGEYTGLEFHGRYQYRFTNSVLSIQANFDMVDAQMKTASHMPTYSRIFIPSENGNFMVAVVRKGWKAAVNARYTGKRFITTDNSEALPAFGLLDASIAYSLSKPMHKAAWEFGISSENILGTFYQVMPGKAMPLRGFRISLRANFKQ